MGAFRSWLSAIMIAAMVISIVYALVPKGSIRAIFRVSGGLILMLIILHPLTGDTLGNLKNRFEEQEAEVNAQIRYLEENRETEMAHIIEEETSAYISDKAAQLGITCQAEVQTELYDNVPRPVSVTLNIPPNEQLSEVIHQDLGISAEDQKWQED